MNRRRRRHPEAPEVDDRQVVVVGRRGDCGNRTKHPGLDHLAQLRRIREEVGGGPARVVSSACLDACEHPALTARRVGSLEDTWQTLIERLRR